jgi:hypothetical protein
MFELDLLEGLDDSEDFDSDVETLGRLTVAHSTTSSLHAVFHWYLAEYWGSVLGVEIWT